MGMSEVTRRTFRCDRCGHSVDRDSSVDLPQGWQEVREVRAAGMGGAAIHEPRFPYYLCSRCADAVRLILDQVPGELQELREILEDALSKPEPVEYVAENANTFVSEWLPRLLELLDRLEGAHDG